MQSLNMVLVVVLLLDYIRLLFSQNKALGAVGKYYHSFSPANLHGKFIFAPVSLLGGCALVLEFLYFVNGKKGLSNIEFYFITCGVSFLTIGDSFVFLIKTIKK